MQLSLLDRGRDPCFDPEFVQCRRIRLDDQAWVDHTPGWVTGHDALFERLRQSLKWEHHNRRMYERRVDVPRLTAGLGRAIEHAPILGEMAAVIGTRYRVELSSITFALYRDGCDSVAWHRDKHVRDRSDGCVAIVSLGGTRRFALRPLGGGRSHSLTVGWGDLVVMGGMCCRHWEHCVPKLREADPRISVMFREKREEPER